MEQAPIARRPFRVEASRDQWRYFVTDATGRLVGYVEHDQRQQEWIAFVRRDLMRGAHAATDSWTIDFVGVFAGPYGQADAVTAIEKRICAGSPSP